MMMGGVQASTTTKDLMPSKHPQERDSSIFLLDISHAAYLPSRAEESFSIRIVSLCPLEVGVLQPRDSPRRPRS